MKKFFSLVLALVMALSLTAVAWGAYTDLASVATGSTSYAGGTRTAYVLDDDLTLDGTVSLTTPIYVGTGKDVTISSTQGVVITTSLTDAIHVAEGGKLTLGAGVTIESTAGAVLWADGGAITIAGTEITSSGTQTVAYVSGTGSLTVNSGSITASGAAKVICVDGATASATVNGGTVAATHSSNIETVQVLGGTFTVDGNATVTSVASSTIAIGTAGGTVNIKGGTVSTADDEFAAAFGYSGTINVTGGTVKNTNAANTSVALAAPGAAVTVSGGNVQSVAVTGTGGSVSVTGGTFSSDVSEYVADGYVLENGTVVNNAGQHVGATSALTSSKAVCGPTLAAALANTTETVTVKAGLSASTELKSFATYQLEKKNVTTGLISNDGSQYVIVPTAVNADMVVVDGSKIVYLAKVTGAVKYNDVAKAVEVAYDADPDCGDVYVDSTADAGTYYLHKNEYYVESTTGTLFNVDGMAVYATKTNLVKTLAHTYDFDTKTVGTKTEVTKVYCTACKANFAFAVGGVEDAVKAFGAGNYTDTGLNAPNGKDIFVRTASGIVYVPVTGTTTTTVQSAATFDAGIAMYVGMSVLAATGSAVVIGKKKD